jgi:hypothetical protein
MWGPGARISHSNLRNRSTYLLSPCMRTDQLYTAFVQRKQLTGSPGAAKKSLCLQHGFPRCFQPNALRPGAVGR